MCGIKTKFTWEQDLNYFKRSMENITEIFFNIFFISQYLYLVCFVTHEVWGGILIGLVGWRPSPSGSSSVLYEKEKRSIVENKCVASTLYLN